MAKKDKKSEKEEVSKSSESSVDKTIKAKLDLLKNLDEGFTTINEENSDNIIRLSSGIEDLDEILGGGYPKGRIIEIYGPEASGKTWLLLKLYAWAIRNGLTVVHIDAEHSLNAPFAASNGVDMSKFIFIQPEAKSAEEILTYVIDICESGQFDIVGVDSTASLIPKAELEQSLGDSQVPGAMAMAMTRALRKIGPAASASGTTVFFINQLRESFNMGGGGKPAAPHTPGGRALKHYCSLRLEAKAGYVQKSKNPEFFDGERQIGHPLECFVKKNRTAPPFGRTEIKLFYCPKTRIEELVYSGMNKGVILQAANNHRKITYREGQTLLPSRAAYKEAFEWLKDVGLACKFLEDMEIEDFSEFIDRGELTQEEVDAYIESSAEPEEEK